MNKFGHIECTPIIIISSLAKLYLKIKINIFFSQQQQASSNQFNVDFINLFLLILNHINYLNISFTVVGI